MTQVRFCVSLPSSSPYLGGITAVCVHCSRWKTLHESSDISQKMMWDRSNPRLTFNLDRLKWISESSLSWQGQPTKMKLEFKKLVSKMLYSDIVSEQKQLIFLQSITCLSCSSTPTLMTEDRFVSIVYCQWECCSGRVSYKWSELESKSTERFNLTV